MYDAENSARGRLRFPAAALSLESRALGSSAVAASLICALLKLCSVAGNGTSICVSELLVHVRSGYCSIPRIGDRRSIKPMDCQDCHENNAFREAPVRYPATSFLSLSCQGTGYRGSCARFVATPAPAERPPAGLVNAPEPPEHGSTLGH
jgi:hypothetical protein